MLFEEDKEKLAVIIDANSMIHRAYHATLYAVNTETNKYESILNYFKENNIKPNNATKLFLTWILYILNTNQIDYFVACWDSKEQTSRSQLNTEYKANRSRMAPELAIQIDDCRKIIEMCGGVNVWIPGIEADDIGGSISTFFNENNIKTILYSSDKDWTQLVDNDTSVVLIKNGGVKNWIKLTNENFMELSGYECLKPKQVMEFKMLFGDTSDNYKGPLGEKMAKTLLSQYGNIDNIYSHLEELKPAIQTKIKQFCNDEMENGMTCREFAYFMAHIFTTVENIDKNIDSYFKKPVDMFELQNFINDNKFSGFDKYIKKIK